MAAAQFADLAELTKRLRGAPFTLICAPCGQFANQEAPTNDAVYDFVLAKLGSADGSFVVTERLDVNGKNTHPMFHFLKRYSTLYRPRRGKAMPIPWNYGKFVVGPAGDVIAFAGPTASPLSLEEKIRQSIATGKK